MRTTALPRIALVLAFLLGGLLGRAQETPLPPAPPPTPGWVFFDDLVRSRLTLSEDQMKRLLVVDEDYRERYSALGLQPWVHQGYGPLTDQREREIRGVLSPEQYKQWIVDYGGDRSPQAPPTAVPGKP
jgi:hypothetical protein